MTTTTEGATPAPPPPAEPPRRALQWRLPLSARLAVGYGLILLATFAGVLFLAAQLTRAHLEADIDSRLLGTVRSFEEGPTSRVDSVETLEREARAWLASHAFPEDELEAVRIGGEVVLTSVGGLDLEELPQRIELLSATESRWWTLTEDDAEFRALTVPLLIDGGQVGTLVVVSSRAAIAVTLDALIFGIGWAAVAGILFATILGVAAVRRALQPFRKILGTVEDIESGRDLSRRVAYDGPRDELGRLADAFDRMLERIELAFESQRRFISDASHELRTPLAVVRGQLELLGAQLSEAPTKGRAELALDEVDRMNRIVEDLLLLARLDEGMHLELRPTEVDLVIQEAALRVRQVTGRPVTVDADPELIADADSDRLLQVLINLLTNAARHTEPDASITVRSRELGGSVVIDVVDSGEGIPTAELPYVFDRMYRGQRSRTKGRPGAGLGLGIVTSLVQAMKGQVAVTSAVGEGTTFTVTLPLASSPSTEPTRVMAL